MDVLDVFWTGQVEVQEAPIIYHHRCTEAVASCVKLQENLENIGVKADSLGVTGAVLTRQMWSPEKRQMLLPSILHSTTQTIRVISQTLISR